MKYSQSSKKKKFTLSTQNIEQFELKQNKALYSKYSSSQNYYYSKDICDILENQTTTKVIVFKDLETLMEEDEYLKRFYAQKELGNKLRSLLEYYKFHIDIPRIFSKESYQTIYRFYEKRRKIEYAKIKRQLGIEDEVPQEVGRESVEGVIDAGGGEEEEAGKTELVEGLLGEGPEVHAAEDEPGRDVVPEAEGGAAVEHDRAAEGDDPDDGEGQPGRGAVGDGELPAERVGGGGEGELLQAPGAGDAADPEAAGGAEEAAVGVQLQAGGAAAAQEAGPEPDQGQAGAQEEGERRQAAQLEDGGEPERAQRAEPEVAVEAEERVGQQHAEPEGLRAAAEPAQAEPVQQSAQREPAEVEAVLEAVQHQPQPPAAVPPAADEAAALQQDQVQREPAQDAALLPARQGQLQAAAGQVPQQRVHPGPEEAAQLHQPQDPDQAGRPHLSALLALHLLQEEALPPQLPARPLQGNQSLPLPPQKLTLFYPQFVFNALPSFPFIGDALAESLRRRPAKPLGFPA